MKKEEVIAITKALGFILETDNWEDYGEWMTFKLDSDLYERSFSWMWRKEKSIEENLIDARIILFRAGQKSLQKRIFEIVDL